MQLVGLSLRGLSAEVIEVIKVVACLGGEFTEEMFVHSGATADSINQVQSALEIAEEQGLMIYNRESRTGRFSHDKFQESAYALIPEDQKAAFHLQLGRSLRNQLPLNTIRKDFSLVINQIKLGLSQMDDLDEKERYAQLCLKAARKAGKASFFASASEYAEIGILLLVKEVIGNTTSLEDQLQAHVSKITSLAAIDERSAVIAYCIEVLRRLGQPFPRKTNNKRIMWDYLATQRKLSNLSDDDIMTLPELKDPTISAATVFIQQLIPLVQQQQFQYSPIIAFRLVHLTLLHGLSSASSVAFGFYRAVLARSGRQTRGCRFFRLAFRILEKYPSDRWLCRCLIMSHATNVVEPLRDTLKPLMTAHRLGLKSGDLQSGFICAIIHCVIRMLARDPLTTVGRRLLQVADLSRSYNNLVGVHMALLVHGMCCRLMGTVEEPPEATNEEEDISKNALFLACFYLEQPTTINMTLLCQQPRRSNNSQGDPQIGTKWEAITGSNTGKYLPRWPCIRRNGSATTFPF